MVFVNDATRTTIIENLRRGQKIAAIKSYRDATGAGLVDAKNAVEALARENGIAAPAASTANPIAIVATLFAVAVVVLAVVQFVPHH